MIEETYFVGAKPHQRIYSYKIGQKPLKSDVKRFVAEVKVCHFFSFDWESKGTLKRPGGGPSNRLFSSMSSPKTGTTFLFYDALDIPQPIIECLEDYAMPKFNPVSRMISSCSKNASTSTFEE